MFDFQSMKSGLFAERDNVDDAIQYARELAGPAGITAAMTTYNTVLQKLSEEQEKRQAQQNDCIEKLCVSYNAYRTALHSDDSLGVRVWGQELLKAQESLNVRFFDADLIRANIEHNRR